MSIRLKIMPMLLFTPMMGTAILPVRLPRTVYPNVYVYTYDSNGNVTGEQLPENQSEIIPLDSQNNKTTSRDFNLNTSNFSYNGSNNQTESTDPYTQTAANRYLSNGNLDYSTNMMAAADNLLANSSFELDADSNNWPDNWTQAVDTGKTATFAWPGTAKYGNKGVSISNPTGWAIVTCDFLLPPQQINLSSVRM